MDELANWLGYAVMVATGVALVISAYFAVSYYAFKAYKEAQGWCFVVDAVREKHKRQAGEARE